MCPRLCQALAGFGVSDSTAKSRIVQRFIDRLLAHAIWNLSTVRIDYRETTVNAMDEGSVKFR